MKKFSVVKVDICGKKKLINIDKWSKYRKYFVNFPVVCESFPHLYIFKILGQNSINFINSKFVQL